MQRKGRKALYIHIPEALYSQLKLIVGRRNITMTRFIVKLIVEAMQKERELE
jgi:hypothetical protein